MNKLEQYFGKALTLENRPYLIATAIYGDTKLVRRDIAGEKHAKHCGWTIVEDIAIVVVGGECMLAYVYKDDGVLDADGSVSLMPLFDFCFDLADNPAFKAAQRRRLEFLKSQAQTPMDGESK